jgi:hypothetical protein
MSCWSHPFAAPRSSLLFDLLNCNRGTRWQFAKLRGINQIHGLAKTFLAPKVKKIAAISHKPAKLGAVSHFGYLGTDRPFR